MNKEIERLHKRQLARLLSHLEKTGQLTPELVQDLKRAYGFVFEDIKNLLKRQGEDKIWVEQQNKE
jgi:glutamine synthetase adenylyltransferase